jgi:hypothetical protein
MITISLQRNGPRLNFVVQHLLGLKEALIGCFVAMSFSWSVVEVWFALFVRPRKLAAWWQRKRESSETSNQEMPFR